MRLTVQGRVTLASLATLAVGLVIAGVVINVLLVNRLHADEETVLHERVASELAALYVKGGRIELADRPNDAALDALNWVFDGQRVVASSPAGAPLTRAVDALRTVRRRTEVTVGTSVLLLAEPLGSRGVAVVGVSLEPYRSSQQAGFAATLALSVLMLAGGALAARRAARAALRPVSEMSERASEWGEHDLHRRFALGEPRDELTMLAATFDDLLARIEDVLAREQRLSLELAHELRTPLSGIRAEAELALRDPADTGEGLSRILAATDRMDGVIETLMAAARAESTEAPAACDAAAVIDDVLETVEAAAAARGVTISREGSAAVAAEPTLVSRALHPIVENAVRHAASQVRVRVDSRDGCARVYVADDGKGLGSEDVFAPGYSTSGSAGLGLALARRLARSCGGDVSAVAGDPGACFVLELPARLGR